MLKLRNIMSPKRDEYLWINNHDKSKQYLSGTFFYLLKRIADLKEIVIVTYKSIKNVKKIIAASIGYYYVNGQIRFVATSGNATGQIIFYLDDWEEIESIKTPIDSDLKIQSIEKMLCEECPFNIEELCTYPSNTCRHIEKKYEDMEISYTY